MSRKVDPNSVTSQVAEMLVGSQIEFSNPYSSVAVMVSNLRKKKGHWKKIFKIGTINQGTITVVKRVK